MSIEKSKLFQGLIKNDISEDDVQYYEKNPIELLAEIDKLAKEMNKNFGVEGSDVMDIGGLSKCLEVAGVGDNERYGILEVLAAMNKK